METSRCRAFVTAADSGSFTRAAEILGYSPSGVSQLVNAGGRSGLRAAFER